MVTHSTSAIIVLQDYNSIYTKITIVTQEIWYIHIGIVGELLRTGIFPDVQQMNNNKKPNT
jgi:hypothetical protein